jgi:hypothetical protein
MLIILFDIKELLIKNLPWQAKQSMSNTTVTFYGGCVKMWEEFSTNFGDERIDCCITTLRRHTFSFHKGIFDQEQHDCRPPLGLLLSVSPIKDKADSRHLETIEVMAPEKLQKGWELCISTEGHYFEGDGRQKAQI